MGETTEVSRLEQVRGLLQGYGQGHLLACYPALTPPQQATLCETLASLDWEYLAELTETHVRRKPEAEVLGDVEPARYYPVAPKQPEIYRRARAAGEDLVRAGQVAAFTVAGGQGTRLGWDDPKGTFPATPLSSKSLFQVFAEQLRATEHRYGTAVPWYIMTSVTNHAVTQDFFEAHDFFGLGRGNVTLFSQGMMPSFDFSGNLLLGEPHTLATNPDGHGGSLTALAKSGALADMARRGVTQISYFQVDNPNVRCIDPLFLGLHLQDRAEMSSKMIRKVDPKEKVGVFCTVAGRPHVIEYSDLPDALAERRDEDGALHFDAGSIAIHIIGLAFAQRLTEGKGDRLALPFHRAEKTVPHIDPATGERVTPTKPNAVKLERFIFDALPLARRTVILETDRVEEFAPIKNAGGTDSPESSKRLQTERAARWLAAHGVEVPRNAHGEVDAVIEIGPLTALSAEDLAEAELPERIEPGQQVLL